MPPARTPESRVVRWGHLLKVCPAPPTPADAGRNPAKAGSMPAAPERSGDTTYVHRLAEPSPTAEARPSLHKDRGYPARNLPGHAASRERPAFWQAAVRRSEPAARHADQQRDMRALNQACGP